MKTTMKMLKTGLIVLFLTSAIIATAQTTITGNLAKPPLTVGSLSGQSEQGRLDALGTLFNEQYESNNVVLYFRPVTVDPNGSGATLIASLTEDHADRTGPDALAFTHYRWFYLGNSATDQSPGADGTAFNPALATTGLTVPYASANDNKLLLSKLTEGYHYFKVQGFIDSENVGIDNLCDPQEEYFVIYVLPELTVSGSTALAGVTEPFFCEADADIANPANGQTQVTVTATTAFNNLTLPTVPATSDFEYNYRWYSVKVDATGSPIAGAGIDDSNIDPTSLSEVNQINPLEDLQTINPQIENFGQYKILVEVEYAIKDRLLNPVNTDSPTDRVREYVIYRGFIQHNADDLIVKVTPKPGKPHITIENVLD